MGGCVVSGFYELATLILPSFMHSVTFEKRILVVCKDITRQDVINTFSKTTAIDIALLPLFS